MKKVLALVVAVVLTLSGLLIAAETNYEPYLTLYKQELTKSFASPAVELNWKQGMKKDMNFDMSRREIESITPVEIEKDNTGTLLYVEAVYKIYGKLRGEDCVVVINRIILAYFEGETLRADKRIMQNIKIEKKGFQI